jgi:hypothetical protein
MSFAEAYDMTRAALASLLFVVGCAHSAAEDARARESWCRSVIESPSSRPDEKAKCRLLLKDVASRQPEQRTKPARETITGWQLARVTR